MDRSEAKKKLLAQAALFDRVFSSPDGKAVLDELERQFDGTCLKKDKEGRIDPNATLAAAGCREVLLYIKLVRSRNAITARDT